MYGCQIKLPIIPQQIHFKPCINPNKPPNESLIGPIEPQPPAQTHNKTEYPLHTFYNPLLESFLNSATLNKSLIIIW
jgi:hypothetical protein